MKPQSSNDEQDQEYLDDLVEGTSGKKIKHVKSKSNTNRSLKYELQSKYIKIHPSTIEKKYLARAGEAGQLMQQIRAEEAGQLMQQIKAIAHYGEVLQKKYKGNKTVVYRVHNGDEDSLKSNGEKNNTLTLNTEDETSEQQAQKHVHYNTKDPNSPFVSVTNNLENLVNTTFDDRGDTNLRMDVFNEAYAISVLLVDNDRLSPPPQRTDDVYQLPQAEGEKLFTANSDESLTKYVAATFENPFCAKVEVSLLSLYSSRTNVNQNNIFVQSELHAAVDVANIEKVDTVTMVSSTLSDNKITCDDLEPEQHEHLPKILNGEVLNVQKPHYLNRESKKIKEIKIKTQEILKTDNNCTHCTPVALDTALNAMYQKTIDDNWIEEYRTLYNFKEDQCNYVKTLPKKEYGKYFPPNHYINEAKTIVENMKQKQATSISSSSSNTSKAIPKNNGIGI